MRRAIATLLAAVLACGVAACGNDDSADGDRRSGADRASAADRPQTADTAGGGSSAANSTADGVTPASGPRKMLGNFGRPPTKSERAAIVAAVERYHAAVAAHDDVRVCAQMSRAAKRAVSQNVSGSGSCPDDIDPFYSGYSEAMRKAVLDARITEIRVKGSHAMVIGFIPGPRTIKLPMDRERGTWRYGTPGKWAPQT